MTKTRLEAFADGVFALVITLLIFNIKIPVSENEWLESPEQKPVSCKNLFTISQ